MEERLCSPRIPFMQIKSLGYERQKGLAGQIVNVPIDVDTTVKSIPRSYDELHTIQLHIKRKMQYQSDYMCEVFRPNLVFNACEYLEKTPLYRDYGIKVSSNKDTFDITKYRESHCFCCDENDITLQERYDTEINHDENVFCGCEDTLLLSQIPDSITLAPGELVYFLNLRWYYI